MTLRRVLDLVISLLGAALILSALSLFMASGFSLPPWSERPRVLPPEAFEVVRGEGRLAATGFTLRTHPEQGGAWLRLPVADFDAADYGFVRVALGAASDSDASVRLLWRTAADPARVHLQEMQRRGGALFAKLLREPAWQGRIAEIGLLVPEARDLSLQINGASMIPFSVLGYVRAVWRDWTEFEGLLGDSQHFVVGGTTEPLVPMRPAVALWIALTLVLLYLIRGPAPLLAYMPEVLTVVLIGWLVVDARWQNDLLQQLRMDRERFAGLGQEQKYAELDGAAFYRLARWVHDNYGYPSRRVVVHVAPEVPLALTKLRRLAYYLYPFNVSGVLSAALPRTRRLEAGDLIVLIAGPGQEGRGYLRSRVSWPERRRLIERYADDTRYVFEVGGGA
jgi:hypothetical protein